MSKETKTRRRRWPPGKARLEALIEEAIVDAYGGIEAYRRWARGS